MASVTRLCFVCLGNIVRSPLAESLFKYHANQRGVDGKYQVDSAGMADWHIGEPPDLRMRRIASRHGVPHEGIARPFLKEDLDRFDLILVMDEDNYDDIVSLEPSEKQLSKVHFLREYDPEGGPRQEVLDPYYGGIEGFEMVYKVIDRSVQGLLDGFECKTTPERR